MAPKSDNSDAMERSRGGDLSDAPEETEQKVTATDIARGTASKLAIVRSMIESYDHALAQHQEFLDRISATDRARTLGRPRGRRVRIAASRESQAK